MARNKFKKSIGQVLGIAFGTGGAILIVNGFLAVFPQLSNTGKIFVGSLLVVIGVPLLNKLGFGD